MVEFMKAKFDEEADEMKARCEEYRKSENREELAQSTVNTKYQA